MVLSIKKWKSLPNGMKNIAEPNGIENLPNGMEILHICIVNWSMVIVGIKIYLHVITYLSIYTLYM